jgi:CTP:phosphocholine cytidylyltransferase-like protein
LNKKKNLWEKCFVENIDELRMLIQPSGGVRLKDFHYLETFRKNHNFFYFRVHIGNLGKLEGNEKIECYS